MFEIFATVFLFTLMILAGLAILAIPVMIWRNEQTMDKWS